MIELNNREIDTTKSNMRQADAFMLESYDIFLKSLYEKGTQLEEQRQKALEVLAEEKRKLTQAEKDVKVLEKHKERMLERRRESGRIKKTIGSRSPKIFRKTQRRTGRTRKRSKKE